jgi:hypothetical protein
MPLTLKDMSLCRNAQALSGVGAGLQSLVNNIVAESNTGFHYGYGKDAFFNHHYDKDPDTNGGKLGTGVTVKIYYQPATQKEYDNFEVIDKSLGHRSGRRRLAVRCQNDKYSFYMTNHPKTTTVTNKNTYGVFTPIDPAK